jgi:hypothetical protein
MNKLSWGQALLLINARRKKRIPNRTITTKPDPMATILEKGDMP